MPVVDFTAIHPIFVKISHSKLKMSTSWWRCRHGSVMITKVSRINQNESVIFHSDPSDSKCFSLDLSGGPTNRVALPSIELRHKHGYIIIKPVVHLQTLYKINTEKTNK